jgi:2-polyprenyl-6-methoxyphenol hydroxylase-like FAD-dependent oxidoreductase
MNLFDLTGKVAVVSGGAQGLGQATALALAHSGADVMLIDRNLDGANDTADDIRRLGRKALTSNCNVSDPDAIAELFLQVDLAASTFWETVPAMDISPNQKSWRSPTCIASSRISWSAGSRCVSRRDDACWPRDAARS